MYKYLSIRWFWIDRSERMYLCRTCLFIHPIKTSKPWQQLKSKAGTVVPTMVNTPPGNLPKETLQQLWRKQTSNPRGTNAKGIDLIRASSPPSSGEFCLIQFIISQFYQVKISGQTFRFYLIVIKTIDLLPVCLCSAKVFSSSKSEQRNV